jgi:hypothetical protein
VATYTIFGTDDPASLVASAVATEGNASTAFHQSGLSGFKIAGIKVFIPTGTVIAATGHEAHLWIGTGNSPTSILDTAVFSNMLAGQWNTALFDTPITFLANRFYWAQVYFPAGQFGVQTGVFSSTDNVTSVDLSNIKATGSAYITTNQGAYALGASGTVPGNVSSGFSAPWFGVDVLIDDGSGVYPGASDPTGITDSISITRTGLPTTVVASGNAEDPMALVGSDTANLPVGAATAVHTTRRGLFDFRVSWGAITNINTARGPGFVASSARTLGIEFTVLAPCTLVGCRIFKAPTLVSASFPVTVWAFDGPGGSAVARVTETVSGWVEDDGGWREIEFASPLDLDVGTVYNLAYFSENGVHASSAPMFAWDSDVVYPIRVPHWNGLSTGPPGGGVHHVGTGHVPPEIHSETCYYVEPIVEWESDDPVFVADTTRSYFDQWVNGAPSKPFHFSVYFSDPPYLAEYAAMGITTLIAGTSTQDYVDAVKAAGMDHYPYAGQYPIDDPTALETTMAACAEDPAYAACVKGYHLDDEPDLIAPYRQPSLTRTWAQDIRLKDSSRPIVMGLSKVVGINQTFYGMPSGRNMDTANGLFREWAVIPDILMGDFYTLSTDLNESGRFGIFTYAKFTARLRMLNEGTTPIWVAVETTSQRTDQPVPEDTVKACWAVLIAGGQGIVFFDHRFGDQFVTEDFAHMLHNPPMKAAVTAFIARGNSLADALHCPDTGLVTDYTSSNVTEGPYDGTLGVKLHYTTREDATYEYLFAMGITPGDTTATFTIPTWAGETVDVLDESRTVVVDGSGVLTDDFDADYTVHLYRRTL